MGECFIRKFDLHFLLLVFGRWCRLTLVGGVIGECMDLLNVCVHISTWSIYYKSQLLQKQKEPKPEQYHHNKRVRTLYMCMECVLLE